MVLICICFSFDGFWVFDDSSAQSSDLSDSWVLWGSRAYSSLFSVGLICRSVLASPPTLSFSTFVTLTLCQIAIEIGLTCLASSQTVLSICFLLLLLPQERKSKRRNDVYCLLCMPLMNEGRTDNIIDIWWINFIFEVF